MKNAILIITALFAAKLGAQATLPTNWNSGDANNPATTPPTGWSYLNSNGGNLVYTGSGFYMSAPQAMRLDAAGEYVECFYSSKASKCEFYIRHTGASGSFNGKFSLIESANGSKWDTAKSWTTDLPGSMTKISVNLKTTSRYLRWIFVTKGSGYNVAIDDMELFAGVSTTPEIEVYDGADNRYLNNQEVFVGTTSPFTIKIKNKGSVDTLRISAVDITGTDMSFFTENESTIKVDPLGTYTFNITLNSGSAGSKKAVLNIHSNDSNGNGALTIPLYAIQGTKASAPTDQVSTLMATENKAWRIKAKFTDNKAENYIMLVSVGAANTTSISDNVTYEKGAYIGNSRIVYIGPATEVLLDKIISSTLYYIKVIPFNGKKGFENYEDALAQEIQVTTQSGDAGIYYNGISPTNSTFVSDLKAKIRPHFQVFYSNYASTIINNFEMYDTTGNRKAIECYYTGYKHLFAPPFIFDVMSREHAYPYSWMGETSQDSANYSDLHILLPVNQDQANAIRSNYPLNNLKTVTFTFEQGKLGKDSNGVVSYEPRDAVKGLAARANFYVCATYNGSVKKFTIPPASPFITEKQDQYVLKRWNNQFPPSKREIARHEYIASVQNNRNPFIDNPNWACYIDFSDMSWNSSGSCTKPATSNIKPDITVDIKVYPNPAGNMVTVDLSTFTAGTEKTIELFDVAEKQMMKLTTADAQAQINVSQLPAGTYLLRVVNKTESGFYTLIKQ